MDTFEITILSIILLLIGSIVFYFLRDPILALKGILRFLKGHSMNRMTILFAPIWGPFWLFDHFIGLGIFEETFDKVSKPFYIELSKYEKYIIINDIDLHEIKKVLKRFDSEFDIEDYNYSISKTLFSFVEIDDETIIKLSGNTNFETIKHLISYISGNQKGSLLYHATGIFIDNNNIRESFFIHSNLGYDDKLVGRRYRRRKKIFSKLEVERHQDSENKIFFNSNIVDYKRFNFKKNTERIGTARFKELKIL